jgi:hypothetical protein
MEGRQEQSLLPVPQKGVRANKQKKKVACIHDGKRGEEKRKGKERRGKEVWSNEQVHKNKYTKQNRGQKENIPS